MTPDRPRRRAARWVLALALLVFAVAAGSSLWVRQRYRARIHALADAPPAEVALVFGAGLSPNKVPSAVLRQRLDAAIALYHSGKVSRVLLSGDNLDRYHDEPDAMRRYVVGKGVPADRVLEDDKGASTLDSCYRAVSVFGLRRALLVSQEFHLPRALYIANSFGLDADGVAADEGKAAGAPVRPRELFSRTLAFFSVLFKGHPTPPP